MSDWHEEIQRNARAALKAMEEQQRQFSAEMHADCVPSGGYNVNQHTHEGETGMWLFPSEVQPD